MPVTQQQIEYLNAMGIPVWVSRDMAVPELPVTAESEPAAPSAFQSASAFSAAVELLDDTARPSGSGALAEQPAPASADPVSPGAKGLHAANDLIQDLQQGASASSKIADLTALLDDEVVAKPSASIKPVEDLTALGWAELQQSVASCQACSLHTERHQTVFGRGNTQAQWMIVGDIPRLEDEWAQQPFSGEAGELLNAMLKTLGLDSQIVYITNLLKCRPALDRSPSPEHSSQCLSYLQRQIDLVQPQLVLLMGRDTVQQVLGNRQPMSQLRQQLHQREGLSVPLVATYHPAYLLKQPRLKAAAWKDLLFAQRAMQ